LRIPLRWLDDQAPASLPAGTTWGVPVERGRVEGPGQLRLHSGAGAEVPAQFWTLATWPDGSVKWAGCAISGEAVPEGCFVTVVDVGGQPARPSRPVRVEDTDSRVVIDTGALRAELGRPGTEDGLLVSVLRADVVVAEDV